MITALYLGTVVIGTLMRGYIVQQLWLWFIVPLGVIEISLVHGIGLGITTAFLTQYATDEDIQNIQESSTGQKMLCNATRILSYVIMLLVAWMVSLLM